jgi:regulator of sirC expression with transglutaminase-like and TPR domain
VKELWSERDERALADFVAWVDAGDLLAMLYAIEGTSAGDRAADEAALDRWASRVTERVKESASPFMQARALAEILGNEEGFTGDEEDYYHPNNCLLHSVLMRRRGMPILLSAVWIEVGRRAGLAVEGVGMPGHFLVRVGFSPGVLVDPFAGGVRITVDECRRKLEGMSGGKLPWRQDFLRGIGVATIAERVLHNLVGAYGRQNDEAGRFRALTFLSALRPDEPDNLLQRAEIAETLGVRDLAERVYTEIVERFPDTQQAQAAWEKLEGGSGDSPLVN